MKPLGAFAVSVAVKYKLAIDGSTDLPSAVSGLTEAVAFTKLVVLTVTFVSAGIALPLQSAIRKGILTDWPAAKNSCDDIPGNAFDCINGVSQDITKTLSSLTDTLFEVQ